MVTETKGIPSKRQMIREIVVEAKKNKCFVPVFELQIMSKAYVEHYYRSYVLKEDVGEFDMT